ncbi:MAG: acyl-CoA thioesterase [Gammaproteobacteria bacterium]|nr:acyl-CoA thioesterase [Gammaproteobacteria bacterium]
MQELPSIEPSLRVPALVKDSNPSGTMFGGWLMGQVDIAGSIPALVRAKGPVVTVSMHEMNFYAPLFPGDLVSLYAKVIASGKTSIRVHIDCWVQRYAGNMECFKAAQAVIVYVAIDKRGMKRDLPEAD